MSVPDAKAELYATATFRNFFQAQQDALARGEFLDVITIRNGDILLVSTDPEDKKGRMLGFATLDQWNELILPDLQKEGFTVQKLIWREGWRISRTSADVRQLTNFPDADTLRAKIEKEEKEASYKMSLTHAYNLEMFKRALQELGRSDKFVVSNARNPKVVAVFTLKPEESLEIATIDHWTNILVPELQKAKFIVNQPLPTGPCEWTVSLY